MKILLLAGEESGLLYARQLESLLQGDEVRGYADYGFKTADLAVMGFLAVLRRLPYFLRVKRTMERAIDDWRPDVVCTIDYPGLNLKLAAYAKARGIRTVHVVCPQVWAWKKGRIPKIEAALDRLCCFFPFEPALFKPDFATFVGHPLADAFRTPVAKPAADGTQTVALLPGSRLGEITRILPIVLEAAKRLASTGGVRFVIPAANDRAKEAIDRLVTAAALPEGFPLVTQTGGARELLRTAHCAIVASGTATLEAALARCPTVLVYRVDAFLAWFARRVIKEIRHIGLANIIWEKTGEHGPEPMPELLQEAFTAEAVERTIRPWLADAGAHARAVAALENVVRTLETESDALSRIAACVRGTDCA